MKYYLLSILFFSTIVFAEQQPVLAQKQVFFVEQKIVLYNATLALLQDKGFIVNEINYSLGLVKASKRTRYDPQSKDVTWRLTTPSSQFINISLSIRDIGNNKFMVHATLNHELWGIESSLLGGGAKKKLFDTITINDNEIYSELFSLLKKSILIEENML